jgi:hypothetical protein
LTAPFTTRPPSHPAPPRAPPLTLAAELYELLFPRGVRMTAELLAEFERWAELTEKLTAYAYAYAS